MLIVSPFLSVVADPHLCLLGQRLDALVEAVEIEFGFKLWWKSSRKSNSMSLAVPGGRAGGCASIRELGAVDLAPYSVLANRALGRGDGCLRGEKN